MPDTTDILRRIDREIWLVTAEHDGKRGGLIATFVSQASIVPEAPCMLIGIAKHHHTWKLIDASQAFTLHLLDESHLDWVWHFGLQSSNPSPLPPGEGPGVRVLDKFAGMPGPLNAVAWMQCRVETALDTGDRTIYVGEVLDARLEKATPALTMKRLLELAPPERLQKMRDDDMTHDIGIDGAAIREWRQR